MFNKVEQIEKIMKEIMKNNGVEDWKGFKPDELVGIYNILENENKSIPNNYQVKSIKVSSKEQLEKIMEVLEDITNEKKEFLA